MFWTPARIKKLKAMWPSAHLSCEDIAKKIGCTTNAAIGKAHRIGLPHRANRRTPEVYRAAYYKARNQLSA